MEEPMTIEQLQTLIRLGLVRLVALTTGGEVYELTHAGRVLARRGGR
jgi:hypothetical protein